MPRMLRGAALVLAFVAFSAAAQVEPPNGVLLVAKAGMPDPRFRNTVILVTQTPDAQTLGVILNRPSALAVRELRPDAPRDGYAGPVYLGGPVLGRIVVALFKSAEAPRAPAFHVLKNVYLSMHPGAVDPLLAQRGPPARFFAGFSGWAPRQLENELRANAWYVLPASEEIVFRKDTSGLWEELRDRALKRRAALYWPS